MDTRLAITSRRDERAYLPSRLSPEVVERILDAGRLAGSARNRQPWTFVVVEDDAARSGLAGAVFVPENVLGASLVVAVTVEGSGSVLFDAGRAAQNMLLVAWNEGVASCPNGVADAARAASAIGREGEGQIAIVLSFGLPAKARDVAARTADDWSERANRRSLADVVRKV